MKNSLNKLKMWFLSEKPQYLSLISLVLLIFCYMTLKVLEPQVGVSVRVSLCIICYMSSQNILESKRNIETVFKKIWQKISLFFLEVYSFIAMVGFYFIYSTASYSFPYSKLVYAMMAFLWIRPVVLFALSELLKLSEKVMLCDHKARIKTRIELVILLMIPCMLFLIAFNPAITSYDSEFCFGQAHIVGQAGVELQDWHPPFYIAVLSLLIRICDSISFIVILQCIAFAIVFVDGILFLYECGLSKTALSFIYVFIGFGFSNILQLVTLWKDIPYMISLMWLTILLIKYVLKTEKYEKNIYWYLQFVISIIFTAFFRQNGILGVIVVIGLLPIVTKFSKKMIITSVMCSALIILIKGPLYGALNVVSVPQLKFFSMANDIMFSYYAGCELSDEAMEVVNKVTENNPDEYEYSPWWVYYNENEPSGYSIMGFLKIYFKNFVQNPKSSIMALAVRNSDIWSIVRPQDEPPSCVNFKNERNTYEPPIYPLRIENGLTVLLQNICDKLTHNPIIYIFYWRTGIYNLLMIMMMVIMFCVKKKRIIFSIMPFIPAVVGLGALFISSGWSDYRYFWPNMTISIFLLYYFILNLRKQI